MAQAILPQPAPRLHTRPVAVPSPDEVLAFCEAGHTNKQAAERWHISERYVRKLKARARNQNDAEDRLPAVVESRPATLVTVTSEARTFPETNGADIAGDHTLWKDPWTGELLNPPPGAIRREWEAERRAARARHMTALMSNEPEQSAPVIAVPPEQDRPTEPVCEASASAVPARNTEETPAPRIRSVPPVPVRVERVVVRLPAAPPASRDLYSRLSTLNLDTLAGPQLAIPVAVLLIVLAFGLL